MTETNVWADLLKCFQPPHYSMSLCAQRITDSDRNFLEQAGGADAARWQIIGAGNDEIASFKTAATYAAVVVGYDDGPHTWECWLDVLMGDLINDDALEPEFQIDTYDLARELTSVSDYEIDDLWGRSQRLVHKLGTEARKCEYGRRQSRAVKATSNESQCASIPAEYSEAASAVDSGDSTVSSITVKWRRARLREYVRREGISVRDLARRLAMTDTAIYGILREDRSRFSKGTRDRLISVLGLSLADWNRSQ